jgi:hypothetical protein
MNLNIPKMLWHELSRLFRGNWNHPLSVFMSLSIFPDWCIWGLFPLILALQSTEEGKSAEFMCQMKTLDKKATVVWYR